MIAGSAVIQTIGSLSPVLLPAIVITQYYTASELFDLISVRKGKMEQLYLHQEDYVNNLGI